MDNSSTPVIPSPANSTNLCFSTINVVCIGLASASAVLFIMMISLLIRKIISHKRKTKLVESTRERNAALEKMFDSINDKYSYFPVKGKKTIVENVAQGYAGQDEESSIAKKILDKWLMPTLKPMAAKMSEELAQDKVTVVLKPHKATAVMSERYGVIFTGVGLASRSTRIQELSPSFNKQKNEDQIIHCFYGLVETAEKNDDRFEAIKTLHLLIETIERYWETKKRKQCDGSKDTSEDNTKRNAAIVKREKVDDGEIADYKFWKRPIRKSPVRILDSKDSYKTLTSVKTHDYELVGFKKFIAPRQAKKQEHSDAPLLPPPSPNTKPILLNAGDRKSKPSSK